MPVAWHPTRWWGWCILGDETKKTEPHFWLMKSSTKVNRSWKDDKKLVKIGKR